MGVDDDIDHKTHLIRAHFSNLPNANFDLKRLLNSIGKQGRAGEGCRFWVVEEEEDDDLQYQQKQKHKFQFATINFMICSCDICAYQHTFWPVAKQWKSLRKFLLGLHGGGVVMQKAKISHLTKLKLERWVDRSMETSDGIRTDNINDIDVNPHKKSTKIPQPISEIIKLLPRHLRYRKRLCVGTWRGKWSGDCNFNSCSNLLLSQRKNRPFFEKSGKSLFIVPAKHHPYLSSQKCFVNFENFSVFKHWSLAKVKIGSYTRSHLFSRPHYAYDARLGRIRDFHADLLVADDERGNARHFFSKNLKFFSQKEISEKKKRLFPCNSAIGGISLMNGSNTSSDDSFNFRVGRLIDLGLKDDESNENCADQLNDLNTDMTNENDFSTHSNSDSDEFLQEQSTDNQVMHKVYADMFGIFSNDNHTNATQQPNHQRQDSNLIIWPIISRFEPPSYWWRPKAGYNLLIPNTQQQLMAQAAENSFYASPDVSNDNNDGLFVGFSANIPDQASYVSNSTTLAPRKTSRTIDGKIELNERHLKRTRTLKACSLQLFMSGRDEDKNNFLISPSISDRLQIEQQINEQYERYRQPFTLDWKNRRSQSRKKNRRR